MLLSFFVPSFALAQISVESTGLKDTATGVNGGPYGALEGDIGFYIGDRLINPLFGLVGVIFLVLIIYGGVLWMVGGALDTVKKAKSIITNSVIGLLILMLAYAFTTFIVSALTGSV